MFKKLITTLLLSLAAVTAHAEYKMIVPQAPGGGTDIWARIVATEWEKKLGEKITVVNIPGINDIPGFNEFHNKLQYDDKVIMVAHGGNAESFLLHDVDYNYFQYQPIGLQNLTIVTGHRKDADINNKIVFGYSSGSNPDAMSMTLMLCGPDKTLEQYLACWNEKFVYVKGMKGNERRLAYMRGELTATRETPAAYFKHSRNVPENVDWYSAGVLNLTNGKIMEDPNFPGITFEQVFEKKWGVPPSGYLYDAYVLVKMYRDALQKSLWVREGNPNTQKLIDSLRATVNDPVSSAKIEADTGKYGWILGTDIHLVLAVLNVLTTEETLHNLVWWSENAHEQTATFKQELVRK